MTASGLTRSRPRASGGKINGSSSRDAGAMCLPRGVGHCSESTHSETHAAPERKCIKCHQGCPLQVFSWQNQMCDMKMELAKEKDACEAQIENKTAGRYVVCLCVCSTFLLPVSH